MRWGLAGLVMLATVGCIREDPAKGRLAVGSGIMVYLPPDAREQSLIFFTNDPSPGHARYCHPGDRMIVVDDDGIGDGRMIRVRAETGDWAGHVGELLRENLRPIPH